MEDSWFQALHEEFTKPYFLNLKKFLKAQKTSKVQVFPPEQDIYSWSRLTPLDKVKVVILGQDPYHNVNQAHGLAFSVKAPTPPPPSLKNMYKGLKIDYPEFEIPSGTSAGDLTKWAQQGVLLLNACLTVKAHEANSHSKKGWEQFTEKVLEVLILSAQSDETKNLVFFLWGAPAQKRIENINKKQLIDLETQRIHILKSVHPSPLSARRGFFDGHHYRLGNHWLISRGETPIDWSLSPGNKLEHGKAILSTN